MLRGEGRWPRVCCVGRGAARGGELRAGIVSRELGQMGAGRRQELVLHGATHSLYIYYVVLLLF